MTPGGSISNMYALMIARHKLYPQHKKHGMRAIKGQLIMYTSRHVRISLIKTLRDNYIDNYIDSRDWNSNKYAKG